MVNKLKLTAAAAAAAAIGALALSAPAAAQVRLHDGTVLSQQEAAYYAQMLGVPVSQLPQAYYQLQVYYQQQAAYQQQVLQQQMMQQYYQYYGGGYGGGYGSGGGGYNGWTGSTWSPALGGSAYGTGTGVASDGCTYVSSGSYSADFC